MSKLFLAILSAFFLYTQSSVAGDHIGNGGDGVLCMGAGYFYDLYELEKIDGIPADLPEQRISPYEIAQRVIERQSSVDAEFKNRMLSYLNNFASNHVFVLGRMTEIDDNPSREKKRACQFVQAAISIPPLKDKGWSYKINAVFWKKLTRKDQAALILHEILYRFAREKGQRNALSAKMINKAMLMNSEARQNSCWLLAQRQKLNLVATGEKAFIQDRYVDISRNLVSSDCSLQ